MVCMSPLVEISFKKFHTTLRSLFHTSLVAASVWRYESAPSAAYRASLALNPTFRNALTANYFYNNLGWCLHDSDPAAALGYYREAIRFDARPPVPNVYLNAGGLYSRVFHDFPAAVDSYARALEIDPVSYTHLTLPTSDLV